ncbi:hypothetical protein PI124_g20110 [Phytophthora idaei]|nr:hypothetical protein PI124_g20110 [Phytophthora idaei]
MAIVRALYPDTIRTLRSSRDNGDAGDCSSDEQADEQVPEEVSVSRLTERRREEELAEEKNRDLAQIMRSYVKQRDLAAITTLKRSPK